MSVMRSRHFWTSLTWGVVSAMPTNQKTLNVSHSLSCIPLLLFFLFWERERERVAAAQNWAADGSSTCTCFCLLASSIRCMDSSHKIASNGCWSAKHSTHLIITRLLKLKVRASTHSLNLHSCRQLFSPISLSRLAIMCHNPRKMGCTSFCGLLP